MKRRVVGFDLALAVAGQLLYKLLGFAIVALLARGLGAAEFGFLMFALATCELAALATEFGSSTHLTREAAVAPSSASRLLGEVLGLRLILAVAYLGVMTGIAFVLPTGQATTFLAVASYAGLKDLSRSYSAAFYGTRRVALAVGPFASHLGILALGVWLATAFGIGTIADAYLLAGIWLIALSSALGRRIGSVRPSARAWRRVVAASLPLFGFGLLTMIQLRIDASLLGLLRTYGEVADYAASARLFEASQAIVRPISLVFLPIVAGLAAAQAYPALRRSLIRLAALAFLVGTATALVAAVVADEAIRFVYGPGFGPAAGVLRIHFAATPFVFAGAVALFHLTALRRERAALVCGAASVALNVALDLLLIPSAGAPGAAVATLAAELTLCVALLTLALRTLATAGTGRPTADRHAAPLAHG